MQTFGLNVGIFMRFSPEVCIIYVDYPVFYFMFYYRFLHIER